MALAAWAPVQAWAPVLRQVVALVEGVDVLLVLLPAAVGALEVQAIVVQVVLAEGATVA